MRTIPRVTICLLTIVVLISCTTTEKLPQPAEPPISTPTPLPSSTSTPDPITPTQTATIEAPAVATLLPVAPTEQIYLLCSPLQDHPLQDLPGIISDPYNPPPMGNDARHQGVDFSYYQYGDRTTILGVTVQAIISGTVRMVLLNRIPYGYAVMIETPQADLPDKLVEILHLAPDNSLYTLYAHLLEVPLVFPDAPVNCGQAIGLVGQSGGENTPYALPHLHVEMRQGPAGVSFESMAFYDTRATQAEMDAYLRWRTSGEFLHFDPLIVLAQNPVLP